jgi:hypothetical protein
MSCPILGHRKLTSGFPNRAGESWRNEKRGKKEQFNADVVAH